MSALFCIHGHFYQPDRKHPWLEVVEVEDSAAPAHDWNTRINTECYAPNAAARILDAAGRIDHIVNNYEAISFNIGPTLADWLEDHAPDVCPDPARGPRQPGRAGLWQRHRPAVQPRHHAPRRPR